jgi:hypothetical protein
VKGDSIPPDYSLPVSAEIRLHIIKSPEAANTTITEHWGQRDQPAVIQYAIERFWGYKLVVIAHSVGGKL